MLALSPTICGSVELSPYQHPLEGFLRDVVAHERLGEKDRDAILSLPFRQRKLDAGSYLVREGSLPVNCSLLVDGYAYRQKMTGDGARQIENPACLIIHRDETLRCLIRLGTGARQVERFAGVRLQMPGRSGFREANAPDVSNFRGSGTGIRTRTRG